MSSSNQFLGEGPQQNAENNGLSTIGKIEAPKATVTNRTNVFANISAEGADQIIASTNGDLVSADTISVTERRQWLLQTSAETLQLLDRNYTQTWTAERQRSTTSNSGSRFEIAHGQGQKLKT